jgi:competence transcription factor ComK
LGIIDITQTPPIMSDFATRVYYFM